MRRVPIKEARNLARRLDMRIAVLLLIENNGKQHVVTFGEKYDDCVEAASLGNEIKAYILEWPPEICNAKPARQKRKERKNE